MAQSDAMPSRTSIMVAAARAFGSREPDESVRNPDWMAERLLGPEELALIHEHPLSSAFARNYAEAAKDLEIFELVMLMLIRTRFLDELFQRALREGIEEFVILGAGFDSRAYRFADELGTRKVIEVDSAVTQEWKRRRVEAALGGLPANVTYAPMDFTRETLGDVLL